jgi:type IV pilus assembly protein PilN
MIRVNLLPQELKKRKKVALVDRTLIYVILLIVIELAGLYSVTISQKTKIHSLEDEIVAVQAEIKKYEPLLKMVDEAVSLKERIMQRMTAIQSLEAQRLIWVRTLEELAIVLPDNLWFRTLTFNEADSRIMLTGVSFSIKDVAKLIINLIGSKMFANIVPGPLEKASVGAKNVYNFSCSMTLVQALPQDLTKGEFKLSEQKKQEQKVQRPSDLTAKGREALGVNKDAARQSMQGLAP